MQLLRFALPSLANRRTLCELEEHCITTLSNCKGTDHCTGTLCINKRALCKGTLCKGTLCRDITV